jgi:hypothetical protein
MLQETRATNYCDPKFGADAGSLYRDKAAVPEYDAQGPGPIKWVRRRALALVARCSLRARLALYGKCRGYSYSTPDSAMGGLQGRGVRSPLLCSPTPRAPPCMCRRRCRQMRATDYAADPDYLLDSGTSGLIPGRGDDMWLLSAMAAVAAHPSTDPADPGCATGRA